MRETNLDEKEMNNKVVVEIEIDLETLANADFHPNLHVRHLARRALLDTALDALSPEDKIRLEKYQEGENG